MWKRLKKKHEHLIKFGIGGVIALVACIIVCIWHISDVRENFETELANKIVNFLEIASYMVEEQNSDVEVVSNFAVNELSEVIENKLMSDAAIDNAINRIIKEYREDNKYLDAAYINNDSKTYAPGNPNRFIDYSEYLGFMEPYVYLENGSEYLSDVNDAVLIHINPVFCDDEKKGVLVTVVLFDKSVMTSDFSPLKETDSIFLVKTNGTIISKRVSGIKDNGDNNIFTWIEQNIQDTHDNIENIAYMKESIKTDASVSRNYTTDGEDLFVSFYRIDSIKKVYFAHVYSSDVIADIIAPLLQRSIAACVVIVIILLSLIILVWYWLHRNMLVIQKLAYEDPITKGKNFNYFIERAEDIIYQSKKKSFVVIRFDISNFRYINESYGHLKADELLTIVSMESSRMFTGHEMCVRMNADQYVLLMENKYDYLVQIEKLVDKVNVRAIDIGITFPIKLKCGIYVVRKGDLDINIIIDRANVARKSLNGEDREFYAIYSDRIISDMRKLDKIEVDMEKALIDEEFKVYLQPKWDIKNDTVYGAEALVRWIKPDGTMVYPDMFIPVFEKNGFIEKLDFYMLESVCRMMQNLARAGLPVFPVSVNQSRRLLDNPDYVEHVANILKFYNVPKRMIELEVTETMFSGDQKKMISIVTELKTHGVLLSMDDFGSGYSSLNLLKDVPFDVLKIDRGFFSESITSESSIWILQKIIEMAEGLDIRVLCEGVETAEQVELLKKFGCNYVQGYYYSKPISTAAFLEKYFGDYIELSEDDDEDYTDE